MSAIGTMHIIWAEPTALFNIFSFYNGLKPVATILVEPMALKNKRKVNVSNTQDFKPIAIGTMRIKTVSPKNLSFFAIFIIGLGYNFNAVMFFEYFKN